jgi:hypothetical protein
VVETYVIRIGMRKKGHAPNQGDLRGTVEHVGSTTALVLRDRGFDDAAIAAALSFELEAIPVLVGVAEEKLAALTTTTSPCSGAVGECGRQPSVRVEKDIESIRGGR